MDRCGFPTKPVSAAMVQRGAGNALYPLGRCQGLQRRSRNCPSPGRLPARAWSGRRHGSTEAARAQLLKLCPDFSTEDFIRRGLLVERPEQLELLRQGLLKAGLPK